MIDKITLVLGGVNSGKSLFGEDLARQYERHPVCLETAEQREDEQKFHIRRHQRRRAEHFDMRKAQHDLRPVLAKCAGRTVLVDSLTRHLQNRLRNGTGNHNSEQLWENDRGYLNELISIQKEKRINLILLSDELGYAPLAQDDAGRKIQELLGNWNQHLAHLSHQVIRVSAGIPQLLKREAAARFRIGAPSNVLPGDLIHRLFHLSGELDDIQLVFADCSPLDPHLLNHLKDLKDGQDLSYSVRLPLKPPLDGSLSESLDRLLPFMEMLAPLKPLTHTVDFVCPPAAVAGGDHASVCEQYNRFFSRLREALPKTTFSLRNLSCPLADLDPVIDASAIAYAIDLGHLLKFNHPLSEVRERLSQAASVHLHHVGSCGDSGAEPLDGQPLPAFAPYFSMLTEYSGLLIIENSHPRHLQQSLEAIRSYF